ncbi:hypothetical protein [Bifidobacterium moukalabense]|uniref:hypothetical protein n=1 Tax=Bifidobacterium moukalabense TaxID=1333651 RepID=UPI0010F47EF6|nr:hypothetical protein [Bifidobacterium moukalabense]
MTTRSWKWPFSNDSDSSDPQSAVMEGAGENTIRPKTPESKSCTPKRKYDPLPQPLQSRMQVTGSDIAPRTVTKAHRAQNKASMPHPA